MQLLDLFPCRTIESCEHEPYLTRWTLLRLGEWFAIFLHKFHQSDEDKLHDHPWEFVTILLNHGYWEWTSMYQCYWRRAGSILYRPAKWRHRIELVRVPTWTLVFRFRREREWGFWDGDNFIQWQNWWRTNCA